jgi:ABC-type antimicrobial peptide transport system permease subunit
MIVIGVVIGTAGSILVGRALEAQLFDVKAADPISLGAAAASFASVALAICLLPAARAARTDVLTALHHE